MLEPNDAAVEVYEVPYIPTVWNLKTPFHQNVGNTSLTTTIDHHFHIIDLLHSTLPFTILPKRCPNIISR